MQLPPISEKKHYSEGEAKKYLGTTFHPKALNKLFESYVLPPVKSNREISDIHLEESSDVNKKCNSFTKKKCNGAQLIFISHDNLVYPSAKDSHEIVIKNKQIYERMQQIMNAIELEELHAAFKLCKEQQKQLKALIQHTRVEKLEKKKDVEEDEEQKSAAEKNEKKEVLDLYLIEFTKLVGRRSSDGTLFITP